MTLKNIFLNESQATNFEAIRYKDNEFKNYFKNIQ